MKNTCNPLGRRGYCWLVNKQSLLIVGPGSSFTGEIIDVFSDKGFSIGIIGRNEARLEEVSRLLTTKRISHTVRVADVAREDELAGAINEMADILPPWNTIIYNVKDSPKGDVLTVKAKSVVDSFASNVVGAMNVGKIALEAWPRTEQASIILSGGGYKDVPHNEKVALSLSKSGLHTLGILMLEAYGPHGVNVHEVVIDGEVGSDLISPRKLAEKYLQLALSRT